METTHNTADKLYAFGKKSRFYLLAGRIILFLLIFILLWLSITLADTVFFFSRLTRWGLFFVNITIVVFLFYKLIRQPFLGWFRLKPEADLSSIATEIGKDDPAIKDHLVNLYQLSREKPTPLLNAAVNQLAGSLSDKSYQEKLTFKQFLPGLKLMVPVLLSALVLLSFMGNEIFHSTLRLLNPANNYAKLPSYTFVVSPGNKDIIYNQPLEIKTKYTGPIVENMHVVLFGEQEASGPRIIPMDQNESGYFVRLKNVTASFSYQISAKTQSLEIEDRLNSETYTIHVLIPPKIRDLSLKTIYPAYSKIPAVQNELNDGNVTALQGSRVELKFSSNKVLQQTLLVFSDDDTIHIENKGKVASGKFTVRKNVSYKILIRDTENLYNQNPISYSVSVLPDNPPYVDISEPGRDIEAQLEDIIRIKVDAADDFGLSNVFLRYRYIKQNDSADSSWHNLNFEEFRTGNTRAGLITFLDFSKFFVGYNDQLEYYAVAVDNNNVNGFASSKSAVYRIRFPSLDELFNEFTEHEEEKIDELQDISKESENLKEKLEEINRELKRTEKLDWDLKKQIENSIEQQKNTQEKIEKIQQDIQDMVDKLDQNSLMNPDILEKYNELQNLFQEIAPPELMEAMKKLQQAMENANPNEVEKALENFKLNQETFQASLERTLELFKQVQLEQQMDQLLQQAKKLAENQEKISQRLEENTMDTKEQGELQNEQAQQKELLESLKRNMDRVIEQEQLQKFPQAKDQLQKTSAEIDEKKLNDQMEQLQKQLNQQQNAQSIEKSENLQHSFESIEQQIASVQQNLQQQHKQNVQKKMLSAAQKMLQLSHEQEKIQQKTKEASQLNDDIREMARQQAQLQNNLSKLMSDIIQLSKETFFLTPDMNKDLANAATNMQMSLDNLSERRNSQAANEQQKAMEALNKSIGSMQSSMEQMAGAESGTGFEQFMQQLQQMAGAQGGLNGETLNFLEGQGNQGQLGMAQQAERQRLAAQQKAIREAMKKMNEDQGNRSDILGRLNELGDAMDEVINDMLADNISRKTIERQRQILSRMLDAQKSVREREYSKKRKAEQAKNYLAIDPKEIKDAQDLRQKKLLEALNKALSEGYHSEYQELINAYFKELSSKKNMDIK